MAAIIKFQSRQVERNESGTSRTIIYSGTLEEMQEILNTQAIGSGMGGERVVSAAISQESGEIWQCEVRYQNDSINDAIVGPDDTAYGKKSAQLACGLLSMPLEAHPKYLACWNYYLATSLPENTVPEWWETAKSTILNDETLELCKEIVRCGALDRVHIGLDYFDASINRIGAYVIGSRATQKCLMQALLEPLAQLREYEANGQGFERLALLEESKSLPWNAVWDEFCLRNDVPVGEAFIAEVQRYERDVTSKRR